MEINSLVQDIDEREVPSGWWSANDPVFNVDLEFLRQFTARLRALDYLSLQFIPIEFSWDALTSEYKNLANLIRPRWHRLFHSSVFPSLYNRNLRGDSGALSVCRDALFLNRPVRRDLLIRHFGQELVDRAFACHFMQEKDGLVSVAFSFVPVGDFILLRDRFDLYQNNAVHNRRYRVSLGSDSIPFAEFLRRFFAGRRCDRALELGSGSGIQIMVASEACDHCVAVDYNERAVKFTAINSTLNGRDNVEARFSNLYASVDGTFDVILANPWFCELRTGGLEEIPGIIDGLNTHLRDGGTCLLMLNAFVQGGSNAVLDYLRDFATKERYDVDLYTLGYGVESVEGIKEWQQYGINHAVSYNAALRKGGSGRVQVHDIHWLRKLVQFGKMWAYRVFHGL